VDTNKLKKFAQAARRQLRHEVAARLEVVLNTDSAELREKEKALNALKNQIAESSREAIIARVAYTWFNRFCALRFMDANRYTHINVVSPPKGFTQPEILAEAKQGHIDETLDRYVDRQKVFDLLGGKIPANDPQNEAYRMLLVAACNYYNAAMPFLFERITDYTELLMPLDLLSETSILNAVVDALPDETCENVEVIGWLYQFYISEKKDEVFEGLKKNKKITPENIPAATQLFTPHWIVRYLVENSLGRLWMLNRPDSRLIEQMDYYIKPEQAETDFLKITSPEEIKICDPACGSGHMLVYAFDLLYAIYEEEGYKPKNISEKILTQNLFGIEIDERAGELAAFALTMKGRSKYRRFFNKGIHPNICVLENVKFEEGELKSYMDEVGRDLFTSAFQTTLHQFEEANNFGSLIHPALTDTNYIKQRLAGKDISSNVFLFDIHQKVQTVLKQADYLSQKYQVVVTNPPYLSGRGMNGRLGAFLKDNYPDVKSDLFASFIIRNTGFALPKGQLGYMSPFVWMFISSYENLRDFLINKKTITSLIQLEYSGFEGATVPICTFTVENLYNPNFKGAYISLSDFRGHKNQGPKALEAIKSIDCGWFYRAASSNFSKIPGSPIAYWLSKNAIENCEALPLLGEFASPKSGMSSCNSELFLRHWHEVKIQSINRSALSHSDAASSQAKWYPYNKGGGFRRWFGFNDIVINWINQGSDIKNFVTNNPKDPNTTHWSRRLFNLEYFFKKGLTWSAVTSGNFSCRISEEGVIPGTGSKTLYHLDQSELYLILALLNTKVASLYLAVFSPTLNFEAGDVAKIPVSDSISIEDIKIESLLDISKIDWDCYETSWDFKIILLLQQDYFNPFIKSAYNNIRDFQKKLIQEMQSLEEQSNRIFIEAYGLEDELTSEVPLKEITLTCNPHYRYTADKSEEELEALLLTDTMKEFISYAVGCMFGRYSLDKPGLILANQGETIKDYLKQIPEPTFSPDEDNVIPMLDGDWFTDDISERFKNFLRTTFGEAHFEENLKFIEDAIGKDIRKFFIKDFYNDHIRRYKKRPIYWLFSSPKGSFNALIYMHRYRPDTVSVVLNDYLREFRTKLNAHKSHLEQVSISASASQTEKTKALKDIEKLNKIIEELEDYERETIYPLATQQLEIDLDDGVKVNYNKFGQALKKVPGLSEK